MEVGCWRLVACAAEENSDVHFGSLTRSRDFLMFMPREATLHTIYSYYLSTVSVNPEGDVNLSAEINLKGLGKSVSSLPVSPSACYPCVSYPFFTTRQ